MRKIIKLLLLISWMILIFILSNQNGTISTNQSNFIVDIAYKITNINKDILVPIVRKTAHITEYFVLFILLYLNLKEYKTKHIFLNSSILSLLYAIFDELHQLYINERSGKISDVFIDCIGIVLGFIIVKLIIKRKNHLN